MNNEEKILGILERIDQRLGDVESDMSEMKNDISGLKTDMSDMKTEVSDMNQRLRKVEVTQETTIMSRLQLLAEGQTTIQEQIRQISVIDRMEDDIATLKNAVRYLSDKVEKLESAM